MKHRKLAERIESKWEEIYNSLDVSNMSDDECREYYINAFEQVLKDTGWISEVPKRFEITYGGSLKMMVGVNNNIPFVETAIDGYGNKLKEDAISIYQQPLPTPPQEDTERECSTCWGEGYLETNDDKDRHECLRCNGTGKLTPKPQESKGVEDEAIDYFNQWVSFFPQGKTRNKIIARRRQFELFGKSFHHHMNKKRLEGMDKDVIAQEINSIMSHALMCYGISKEDWDLATHGVLDYIFSLNKK